MKILNNIVSSILFLTCGLGCGKIAKQESNVDFTLGLSLLDATRGHEDLSRFAVTLANKKIASDIGLNSYYTEVPVGENGGRSTLPMIKGSFDTDWAVTLVRGKRSGEQLLNFYGVAWVNSGSDWQDFPWLQSLHFLRDRDANDQIYSKEESLESARQKVIDAFQQAIRLSKDRRQSDY